MHSSIPCIDLSAFLSGSEEQRRGIASDVDDICRTVGFLIVENHGVPAAIIDRAWSMAKAFFELPLDKKMASRPADPASPRGYFPQESEALARSRGVGSPPDRKEAFSTGPLESPDQSMSREDFDFHYGENLWPDEPPGFRDAWIAYYRAMESLGATVLRLFAKALNLPDEHFERFHTHHIGALRALSYPAAGDPLEPGQEGAGEHSDYGAVTILKPDAEIAGLEIRLPSGVWAEAPPLPDAFVVNIGDMMARWTNDRWISTLHRVRLPAPGGDDAGHCRQSLAFFHNPNFDAEIRCIPTCLGPDDSPKYKTVLAGRYLRERFRSALGYR